MLQYFLYYTGSAPAITFYFPVFSFETQHKIANSNFSVINSFADQRASLGCSPIVTHLVGSVFTGLAWATSWKKIKALERTTNSSLITPSF